MKKLSLLLASLLLSAALAACGADRAYSGSDEDNNNGGSSDAALRDSDGDGLTDAAEEELGTDPQQADSDGDGFSDGDEVELDSDPLNPRSQPEVQARRCTSDDDCVRDMVCIVEIGECAIPASSCSADADCPQGQVCADYGLCVTEDLSCSSDRDCPPGFACGRGSCYMSCEDLDGDGACADEDCDDNDVNISPYQPDWPDNGRDDNCNGEVDEAQVCRVSEDCINRRQQCFGGLCAYTDPRPSCRTDAECGSDEVCVGERCTAATAECVEERPGDGVDNDCDGEVDEGEACRTDADCSNPRQMCVSGVCAY